MKLPLLFWLKSAYTRLFAKPDPPLLETYEMVLIRTLRVDVGVVKSVATEMGNRIGEHYATCFESIEPLHDSVLSLAEKLQELLALATGTEITCNVILKMIDENKIKIVTDDE